MATSLLGDAVIRRDASLHEKEPCRSNTESCIAVASRSKRLAVMNSAISPLGLPVVAEPRQPVQLLQA
jgi:hypothetical protein